MVFKYGKRFCCAPSFNYVMNLHIFCWRCFVQNYLVEKIDVFDHIHGFIPIGFDHGLKVRNWFFKMLKERTYDQMHRD